MDLKTRLKILVIFEEIYTLLENIGDTFRANAYKKWIKKIKNNEKINSESFDKKVITIKKYKIHDDYPLLKNIRYYNSLISIPGFNKKSALKHMNKKLKLTTLQKLGLKYHNNIIRDIDINDVKIIGDKIENILKRHSAITKLTIAGSYRRKKPENISDIDILLIPKKSSEHVSKILKKYLDIIPFVEGKKKFTFLIKYDIKKNKNISLYDEKYIQIDIRYINKEYYPFALLYFTGSKQFNLYIRSKAKYKGYKLNEYGIFNRKTEKRIDNVSTETGILKFLNIDKKYINPVNRNI